MIEVKQEILEIYLSLSETDKALVNQMIFSLLENESCYQQEPCLQD